MTDVPLSEDLVALHVEAQKRVDRVVAARVELAAAITDLVAGREDIFTKSALAVKFIDDYLNPAVVNPEPIAPEVALTLPPEVEIPVFTTVDNEGLTFENTSGGEVAPELVPEVKEEFVTFEEVHSDGEYVAPESGVN